MSRITEIEERLTLPIEAMGAYIVEINLRGDHRNRILEIFIDSDTGVTADLCATITRTVSDILDGEKSLEGPYQLVVSSPGADRPLKLWRQYAKHRGRTMTVEYRQPAGTMLKVKGIMTVVGDEIITLQPEKSELPVDVRFQDIVEARVHTAW